MAEQGRSDGPFSGSRLCQKGCGFYADSVTGYCSKCARQEAEKIEKQKQPQLQQQPLPASQPIAIPNARLHVPDTSGSFLTGKKSGIVIAN